MTSLYVIADGKLCPAVRRALSKESMIEDWVAADPALLGLDALVRYRYERSAARL